MFLDTTLKKNSSLVDTAFLLHQKGEILPDSYVLDLDALLYNATIIKEEADKYNIDLYYMLKQIGRNPVIAKELEKIGYKGAVAVDFKEAKVLMDNGCHLGHIGHLVQIPKSLVYDFVKSKPNHITVYSIEKAKEISEAAAKLKIEQKIMLRVIDKGDNLYPAQYGGFNLEEIVDAAREINSLKNIKIDGLCSFPCLLYSEDKGEFEKQPNVDTIKKAKILIEENLKIKIKELNMPSATCVDSIKMIYENGGTQGEPGHGLTGTTPYHAKNINSKEIPAIVYVSEVSHNLYKESFCYGGGHYRRSHMENALVGTSLKESKRIKVEAPNKESIDYYFTLKENCKVSDTVVMAFRTQIFVTRSNLVIVKGLSAGKPSIVGTFNPLGEKINNKEN